MVFWLLRWRLTIDEQFAEGKSTQEEIPKKLAEHRQDIHAKMLKRLADHQRTHFQKMQGEKFELPDKQQSSLRIPLLLWQFRSNSKKAPPEAPQKLRQKKTSGG